MEVEHANHADSVDWVPWVNLGDAKDFEFGREVEGCDILFKIAHPFKKIVNSICIRL